MFSYFLLAGIGIALLYYAAISWLFPQLSLKLRALSLGIVGIAILMGSVFFGFTGMLFGMLGFGVVGTAFLLLLFGRYQWVTKLLYLLFAVSILILWAQHSFQNNDYWVIRKITNPQGDEVDRYRNELEENGKLRGYKVFTISEGAKAIVLSLGSKQKGTNIEVLDVENRDGTTKINVRTFSNGSPDKNPYIMIGFDRVESDIQIIDTDGTLYQQLK